MLADRGRRQVFQDGRVFDPTVEQGPKGGLVAVVVPAGDLGHQAGQFLISGVSVAVDGPRDVDVLPGDRRASCVGPEPPDGRVASSSNPPLRTLRHARQRTGYGFDMERLSRHCTTSDLEPGRGFEPLTCALRMRCSTG